MKRIDVAAVLAVTGSLYPSPFHEPCRKKNRRRRVTRPSLRSSASTCCGCNRERGRASATGTPRSTSSCTCCRGEVVVVTDGGEEVLRAGDAAGFKAGDRNGHCRQNRSNRLRRCSKSARAPRTTPGITRTSTWRHRRARSRRSTRVVMARHTRTSRGGVYGEGSGME